MMDKKLARLRRAKRTRLNIRESGQIRLSVHRTPRHIYAAMGFSVAVEMLNMWRRNSRRAEAAGAAAKGH